MDLDALMARYSEGVTEAQKREARQQALAAAGFAMLGANTGGGWQGAARALGRGGLLGMGAYNQALGDAAQAPVQNLDMIGKMMALKGQQQSMEDAQRQREKQGQIDALASSSMKPGFSPFQSEDREGNVMQMPGAAPSFDARGFGQGLFGIDPMKALQWQQSLAKESPLDKFKPEHYTPQSLARFQASQNPADLVPITKQESQVGKINPADFTPASVRQFLTGGGDHSVLVPIDKTPRTNISIKNVSETEYDKTIGKQYAEEFGKYQDAGRKAESNIARMNAISKLLDGIDTHAGTNVGMKIAGGARAVGLNIDPNLPAKEAAEALANEMALQSRAGGQMPGAMSDKDREFLQAMNPNVAQTPQGRAQLIEVRKRIAQRERDIARLAREYAAQNRGRLDSGFEAVLSDFAEKNPLFPDVAPKQQTQQNGRAATGRIGGQPAQSGVMRFDSQGNPL